MIFLLGLFCALLAGETALRLGGYVFRLAQERNNRISLDRSTYRIMCIGESTTAGDAKAWPGRLESLLARRYPAARFSVVNKGLVSVNSSRIMQELEANLDEVHPDMVISMMGMNDGFIRYYEGISDAESPLFRHFRLYKWLRIMLNQSVAAPRPLPAPPRNEDRHTGPIDPYEPFENFTEDIARQESLLLEKINRDPGDATSRYILGTHWTLGRGLNTHNPALQKKGEELLLRAARLAPKKDFIFRALGVHYTLSNEFERAIPPLEKAAELNPSVTNWFYLGRACRVNNLPDKAEAAYLKAIDFKRLDGESGEALFELCWLHINRKNYSKAEALLQKARGHNPENETVYGALASLYTESGRPDLARRYTAKLSKTRAMFTEMTRENYKILRRILNSRKIRLAVMQYPMCDLAPLRALLGDPGDIIFIDNERTFKKAVAGKGYVFYFGDMFAGNFGHCTGEGNELIASNAAEALDGYFVRSFRKSGR